MKVYVSGPIYGTGPNGNRAAFEREARSIRAAGHEPVIPHEVDHGHAGPCIGSRPTDRPDDEHMYGCYLLADFPVLAGCDQILMLPGWQDSLGARAELAFARALHIPLYRSVPMALLQ